MRPLKMFIRVATISCAAAACDASYNDVVRADGFDGVWPLTVPSVSIGCGNRATSVFVETDDAAYPLNGTAMTRPDDYEGFKPLEDIKTIQRRDKSMKQHGDIVVDTGDLVTKAIELCRDRGLSQIKQ